MGVLGHFAVTDSINVVTIWSVCALLMWYRWKVWTTKFPIVAGLDGTHMNIKTILHPTDFSASSLHAFEFACSLAREHAARIVMLNVIDNPRRIVEPGLPPQELLERRTEAELWFTTLPMPQGSIETKQMIAEGEPIREILRVAAEERRRLDRPGNTWQNRHPAIHDGERCRECHSAGPMSRCGSKTPATPRRARSISHQR